MASGSRLAAKLAPISAATDIDAWLVTILALKYLGIRQIAGLSLRSLTFREQIALGAATLVLNALLLEMLLLG